MRLSVANSKNGVPIRLTKERWNHITTSHKEIDPENFKSIMEALANPDTILKGDTGELLAIRKRPGSNDWIVVAYKEINKTDGFVITAYITTDKTWLFKRDIIWNKK